MKILWATIDRSMHSAQHFVWFQREVSKIAEVDIICLSTQGLTGRQFGEAKLAGKITDDPIITTHLNKTDDYDFIFCDALFAFSHQEWEDIKISKGFFLEDLHEKMPKQQFQFAKEMGFDVLFTRYKNPLRTHHPRAYDDFDVKWVPHCIVKKDFIEFATHNNKITDILHTGNTGKYYPFRDHIIKTFKNDPRSKIIKRIHDSKKATQPIGINYIKELSLAKIHPTCGSKLEYAVCKFIQIPGANCLLMTPIFQELEELGFRDNENFIATNPKDLKFQVDYYLKNDEERKRISLNGQKLIFKRHTVEIRAKEFIKNIESVI